MIKKFIYSLTCLISGLLVLDFILSFFGTSPFNQGGGLFDQNSGWNSIFIAALIAFGTSTALLINKRASAPTGKRRYIVFVALGIVLVLGALPAGFMLTITVRNTFKFPIIGYNGIGVVLGGIMVVSGVTSIIYGIIKSRQTISR